MKKLNNKEQGINYWESTADILVGLLLVVLLLIMALVLYLAQVKKNINIDDQKGDSYNQYETEDDDADKKKNHDNDHEEDYEDDADSNGGGGGGYSEAEDGHHEDYENPGEGEAKPKAAVYVRVIDGESGSTIKSEGIQFELYENGNVLKTLSTYYPKKVEYKTFATTNDGVFYFPEKIELGDYTVKNISAPEGYDLAASVTATLENEYEWSEPYVVTVTMSPQKNKISITATDVEDGAPLKGATYNVIAKEDVVTLDGTVRYKAGDVVDVIKVDSEGKGESKEIFLGEYELKMKEAPEYYALVDETTEVTVGRKNDSDTTDVKNLNAEKTKCKILVVDALYDTKPVEGASFSVTGGDFAGTESFVTDEYGEILLTNLKKNTTYRIRQTATAENYYIDNDEMSIVVGADGLIEDQKTAEITVKNRCLRAEIAVRDTVFRGQVSDVNVNILDENGDMVYRFTSSGMEEVIESLKPGTYKVVLRGRESSAQTIVVEDRTDVQKYTFRVWTTQGIAGLTGAGVVILATFAALIVGLSRRRRNRASKK